MRYFVGSLVGVAITLALVAAGAAVDASSVEQVEGPTVCDSYGDAMDSIIEEGFPGSREPGLLDESARFDGVQVERDVIESLVREAGFREPSVFDTYDYGDAAALWMMSSPGLW